MNIFNKFGYLFQKKIFFKQFYSFKRCYSNSVFSDIHNVIIIGSGPAGLTAALYTARANLKPIVFHGDIPGGQLTTTTDVENYPGFINGINGVELIENMTKQAEKFGAEFQSREVKKIDISSKPYKLLTFENIYNTKSIIIATGARPKKLGIESESFYWGKGVTSCATCDGFFYKDQDVCVIGGGDSAMEEANFLTRMCNKVYLIHRRDKFRASKIMTDRVLSNKKIELVLNSIVDEILGNGKKVSGVKVKNVNTGIIKEIPLKGVFLAIGHIPNTEIFKGILNMDEQGYLLTEPRSTKTNIEGIFACGDCVDHIYRQVLKNFKNNCIFHKLY
jgi:thioredoxin reductase (NADPH)